MLKFQEFPKIPRLNRDIVVTEKIDGTNASVWIGPVFDEGDNMQVDPADILDSWVDDGVRMCMRAGSRTRWLQPTKTADNYGFAKWVEANAQALRALGAGHHFGEWWGSGIQDGYGMNGTHQRYFSLFNTARWRDGAVDAKGEPLPARPACCDLVPVLYEGPMDMFEIRRCIAMLRVTGSRAAYAKRRPIEDPALGIASWGYRPVVPAEGIIVFHEAARQMFKVTLDNDGVPKSLAPKLERVQAAPIEATIEAWARDLTTFIMEDLA